MKRYLKLTIITVILSLLIVVLYENSFSIASEKATVSLTPAKVIRVVDGDTIVVSFNKKEEKVRFIGVNCPESTIRLEPYGKEASNRV
jgi:endonuclease YncB( thermonuclease family)